MMTSKSNSNEKKLIVSGEDIESEDEDFLEAINSVKISVSDSDKQVSKSTVKVVTFGEAPESDQSDIEDFGSTISLASTVNSIEEASLLKLDSEAAAMLAPILPQRRSPRLDPRVIKKHRETNKSLRINITDKFLTPVIMQSTKKLERLSQNLSNGQMQMQEALFQSRIATGYMLKLQKELENFLELDYLKELKIQPTDLVDEEESEDCNNSNSNNIIDDYPVEDLQTNQSELSSSTLLTASLSGGLI